MAWKVHLQDMLRWGQAGYRMYVMREDYDGCYSMLIKPTMHTMEPHTFAPEDEYFISDENPGVNVKQFLQGMSDAAWEIGIKPKQLESHTDELKAVRYHLEDMRQLAGVRPAEGGVKK